MAENTIREELLKQNGKGNIEMELAGLRQIVDAEQRRVRSLSRWTKGVWISVLVLIVLSVIVSVAGYGAARRHSRQLAAVAAEQNRIRQSASQPATIPATADRTLASQPAIPVTAYGTGVVAVPDRGGYSLIIVLPLILLLSLIGIVLLVFLFFARSKATSNQIRVSLGSMEAQLRVLSAEKTRVPNDPAGGSAGRTT